MFRYFVSRIDCDGRTAAVPVCSMATARSIFADWCGKLPADRWFVGITRYPVRSNGSIVRSKCIHFDRRERTATTEQSSAVG
jgi:hypothetical protein